MDYLIVGKHSQAKASRDTPIRKGASRTANDCERIVRAVDHMQVALVNLDEAGLAFQAALLCRALEETQSELLVQTGTKKVEVG